MILDSHYRVEAMHRLRLLPFEVLQQSFKSLFPLLRRLVDAGGDLGPDALDQVEAHSRRRRLAAQDGEFGVGVGARPPRTRPGRRTFQTRRTMPVHRASSPLGGRAAG